MDRQEDGQTDGQTDRQTDGQIDTEKLELLHIQQKCAPNKIYFNFQKTWTNFNGVESSLIITANHDNFQILAKYGRF